MLSIMRFLLIILLTAIPIIGQAGQYRISVSVCISGRQGTVFYTLHGYQGFEDHTRREPRTRSPFFFFRYSRRAVRNPGLRRYQRQWKTGSWILRSVGTLGYVLERRTKKGDPSFQGYCVLCGSGHSKHPYRHPLSQIVFIMRR